MDKQVTTMLQAAGAPSITLAVETVKALGSATKAGETSIDAWKRASDGLFADGVRLAMLVEDDSGFNAAVHKSVQDCIIASMKGERTAFLLNTESKYLTSGDDKDLKKLAANRLKEHMRAVRKYLKSHEEADKKEPTARLMLSKLVDDLLQEAMNVLSKDQPAKICDIKISESIIAIRACKAQLVGFKILP
jgi:hypothetical protein